jgi:hypothetical protein
VIVAGREGRESKLNRAHLRHSEQGSRKRVSNPRNKLLAPEYTDFRQILSKSKSPDIYASPILITIHPIPFRDNASVLAFICSAARLVC